jgi:hypothetical protein
MHATDVALRVYGRDTNKKLAVSDLGS